MNSKSCLLVIFFCSLMLHTQAVSAAELSSVDLSKLSADAVINTESSTYDSHPSAITLTQGSIRDAIVAGLNLNLFHAHADVVQMTTIPQLVNVLQAMILSYGPAMGLSPT